MAKFRFSMVLDGVERVEEYEIQDGELVSALSEHFGGDYAQNYRYLCIDNYITKWAMSKIQTSWEEIPDEQSQPSDADRPDHSIT